MRQTYAFRCLVKVREPPGLVAPSNVQGALFCVSVLVGIARILKYKCS